MLDRSSFRGGASYRRNALIVGALLVLMVLVGGIMLANNLGNPCLADQSETSSVGGDTETRDMKILFGIGYAQNPDAWIKPDVIRSAAIGAKQKHHARNVGEGRRD
jgi:hypothetical protein